MIRSTQTSPSSAASTQLDCVIVVDPVRVAPALIELARRVDERTQGAAPIRFYREIPLPEGIDPEQAKASFKNGVLEVTMPAQPSMRVVLSSTE